MSAVNLRHMDSIIDYNEADRDAMGAHLAKDALIRNRIRVLPPLEDHENSIHTDRGARSIGYSGGLVEGATLFGKMASLVVPILGQRWLEKGYFTIIFVRPYYYNEDAIIEARCTEKTANRVEFNVQAYAENGGKSPVAIAKMGIDDTAGETDSRVVAYGHARLPKPEERPLELSPCHVNQVLGEITQQTFADFVIPYYRQVKADDTVFNITNGYIYPGLMLSLCNLMFMKNFNVEPWRHLKSHCQFYNLAEVGEELQIRGVIKRIYRYLGNDTADMDLAVLTDKPKLVARVTHTFHFNIQKTEKADRP